MPKIRCTNPNHDDKNASMHLYEETAYCFVCNITVPIGDVLDEEEIRRIQKENKETPKEDIQEKLREIERLPRKWIRGLQLPYIPEEPGSFYIVWPDGSYYKRRTSRDGGSRYLAPRGWKPTLFRCRPEPAGKQVLIVVEGELNALSLDLALSSHNLDIVSPGSCNSFSRFINEYIRYSKIIIFVDKDPAGVYNGIRLKEMLIQKKKEVTLIALEKDFNQLLQEGGKELVKHEFIKELGFDT